MALYADFDYYNNTYKGNSIAVGDFDRLMTRASARIDEFTFDRAAAIIAADDPADEVTAIKMAACAIADEIENQSDVDERQVKSESVGGYSVSYVDNPDVKRTSIERLRLAAKLYLGRTGLMFPGFFTGEYGSNVEELD